MGTTCQMALGALFVAVLASGCSYPPTAVVEPSPPPPSAAVVAADVQGLLTAVRVVATRPHVAGYDRDCGPGDGCVFGTPWSDDTSAPLGRNGCDTRNDVLGRTLLDVVFSPGTRDCKVVAGRLVDPFTGGVLDYATHGSDIHVDHVFPLAAAWDLGAATWTSTQRARFANDVELELLAVSGAANLAKGDSTPASWLPPHRDFRCSYVAAYLRVAAAYSLSVTAADVRVIEDVLRTSCPPG